MAGRLLVLIPPSLTKASGGRRKARAGAFDLVLAEPRYQVVSALDDFIKRATTRQLELTFGARGPLLERARRVTLELVRGQAPLLPAWRRYEGVVWTHLDPATLSPALRRRILIPSGAYGLLGGEDPIADYRLKMNVRLTPMPSLARFWRPTLTKVLDDHVKNATLVNFLPQEHAAGFDFEAFAKPREVVHVHFVARDEGRAVGHDAKAIKGVLARRALSEGLDAMCATTWNGWRVRREGGDVYVVASQ